MTRQILLIEPNYANKYPPIGLMKIAAYHRLLGDDVRFFKGDLRDFVVDCLLEKCLEKLTAIDSNIFWPEKRGILHEFILRKNTKLLDELGIGDSPFQLLLENCLVAFADDFRQGRWPRFDRVYVTTLFTFYWKITVETIHFCKKLVRNPATDLHVGGVLASLLHAELEKETGIKPKQGLLDQPGELDPDLHAARHIIIDNLPLDYSILEEIEYEYPTRSAYFTFMTKGCTRKCAFCSVPILEPTYKPKIETIDKFMEIKARFGEQQNLLLMDNNVLASPNFLEIIDEIKAMGFVKGATYIEPNQLEIAVRNLRDGYNDRAFSRRTFRLLHEMLGRLKRSKKATMQPFYDVLAEHRLLKWETVTKENLLLACPQVADIFEKHRLKNPRRRVVDFNQGTDCRYVTEEIMAKMAEIPIRPLRIAFDYIQLHKQYEAAVRLAAKYGIRELSNYLLYNFKDKPEDLWQRLKINIDLCRELNIQIFSFPMKYIPLFGEEAKGREYTGTHWNKKFVRAIQSILNVTKGIVAPARKGETDENSFFYKAFGKNLDEFFELLWMPETFIVYRFLFEKMGYTEKWKEVFYSLSAFELDEAKAIIQHGDFSNLDSKTDNPRVRLLLDFYVPHRNVVEKDDAERTLLKMYYGSLIRSDRFIELTLTYDFEAGTARRKRAVRPLLSKKKVIEVEEEFLLEV